MAIDDDDDDNNTFSLIILLSNNNSPHSGHPDNSHTLLNVSHLGNEVPGSKKIIIMDPGQFASQTWWSGG